MIDKKFYAHKYKNDPNQLEIAKKNVDTAWVEYGNGGRDPKHYAPYLKEIWRHKLGEGGGGPWCKTMHATINQTTGGDVHVSAN